jgi:hypothetical protein
VTRRDVLALIKAMREQDAKASVVTIDRVASGAHTWSVKAVGRDVRAVAKRAQQIADELERKYNGTK